MSKCSKKIIVTSILLLEGILLILIVLGYLKEKRIIHIPYSELIGTTIPDDREGWYIDNSFPQTEDGLFDYTDGLDLKKGTYDITLYYNTDSYGNTCTTTATTKGFQGLKTDIVKLSPKVSQVTFMVYLYENVYDFCVRNYYCGSGYLIIKDIDIKETTSSININILIFLIFTIIIDFILFTHLYDFKEKITTTQVKIGLTISSIILMASYPLLAGYLSLSYDLPFHLLRIDGIAEALKTWQFPVRIQPNWDYGYGYPVSVFYGDIFLYFPAILRIIGVSVSTAYSCFLILCNTFTALIMYFCLYKVVKDKKISLFGTMLYTLAPYRLQDMYLRCGLGEVIAITFLPLIVWSLYSIFTEDEKIEQYKKLWIPLTIGLTGVIQSHTLTCIMVAIFILLSCIINIKKIFHIKTFIVLLKSVVITIGLNLWFLLPCLQSMADIRVAQDYHSNYRIQDYGAFIPQLFNLFYSSSGGNNFSKAGMQYEMIMGIGLAMGVGLLFCIYYIIVDRKIRKDKSWINGKSIFGMGLLALFMCTKYFPWDYLSTLLGKFNLWITNIQFPMRFLMIADVLIIFAVCIAMMYYKKVFDSNECKYTMLICSGLCIITSMYFINNRTETASADYIYDISSLDRFDYCMNEYLPEGTIIEELVPGEIINSESVDILSYKQDGIEVSTEVMNNNDDIGYVDIPILYYQWYTAKDDKGISLELSPGTNNMIRINLPSEYIGNVHICFQEPSIWRLSELISLLFTIYTIYNIVSIIKIKYSYYRETKKDATVV